MGRTRGPEVEAPHGEDKPIEGFLPIHTNAFDRVFIAVVAFVALHLFWMRFLEAGLSLYGATAISIVLGWFIITRG